MSKAIAITGGSKGIGRAIVKLFADKGFNIITCSRSLADLEGLKTEVLSSNPNIFFESIVADVSTREGMKTFVDFAQTHSTGL